MQLDENQRTELAEAQAQAFETKRPTVAALESRLYEPIPCLDHGFVRLIDYMGDDSAIVLGAS